jgi:CHASE2 domain-containing sensor protein
VVIIQMDNESHEFFQQNRDAPWSRALHAQLVDRLVKDGCRLLVFDVHFRDAGDPSSDQALADALRRMSNVVIAVDQGGLSFQHRNSQMANAASIRPHLPFKPFLEAVHNNWGAALVTWDNDLIVRRHWPFPEATPAGLPGLPWTAARLAGCKARCAAPVVALLR